jgi:hypothetical protein
MHEEGLGSYIYLYILNICNCLSLLHTFGIFALGRHLLQLRCLVTVAILRTLSSVTIGTCHLGAWTRAAPAHHRGGGCVCLHVRSLETARIRSDHLKKKISMAPMAGDLVAMGRRARSTGAQGVRKGRLLCALLTLGRGAALGVQVRTTAGTVRGAYDDGLAVFVGIPYALPPVGKRRFLPPEPAPSRPRGAPALEATFFKPDWCGSSGGGSKGAPEP